MDGPRRGDARDRAGRGPAPGPGAPGAGRGRPAVLPGHLGAAGERGRRAAQLADVQRHPRQPAVQPARPDRPHQRRRPRAQVGPPHPAARPRRDDAARRRRRHVHHRVAEQRDRGGCRHGKAVLALRPSPAGRSADLLRPQQPGGRDSRRPALHEHSRRPSRRHRRPVGRPRVEPGGRRPPQRVQQDRRPPRRQGPDRDGHRRGRVRHPRVPRRLRRPHRGARVADLHDSRTRPPRQPHVGRRFLADRRVADLDHRVLRPRAEPGVLGHRQPRPGLERRRPARRQPLCRLGPRPRRRHRGDVVVLPVHAARRPRLGRDPDPRPGRHRARRRGAQGDAVGQPQRVLLHARPRDRRVPARRGVRSPDLGGRAGLERPADPAAEHVSQPDRHPRRPDRGRRHQLVVARLQPAHRAAVRQRLRRRGAVLPP